MNKITKICLNLCAALIMTSTVAFGLAEDDERPSEHRISELTKRLALMEEEIKKLKAPAVERGEQVELSTNLPTCSSSASPTPMAAPASAVVGKELIQHPIKSPIPDIARGYEAIYERFLKGVLIYRPQEGSDVGRIELPIADLANPLEGIFDLSNCGDTGKYLSIATGYRKGKKPENANKVEIWFTPRFLVDKEMPQLAPNHHMRVISKNWDATRAPIGIFWTWGGWNATDDMKYCDYLTTESIDVLSSENLLKKYEKRRVTRVTMYHTMPVFVRSVFISHTFYFTFRL